MGKYVLATLFLALLALNVAGYVFFVNEIDGSKVTNKQVSEPRSGAPPAR